MTTIDSDGVESAAANCSDCGILHARIDGRGSGFFLLLSKTILSANVQRLSGCIMLLHRRSVEGLRRPGY